MAEDNKTLDNNIRVASASITSLSIFVALSAAIMGFLVSRESLEFQYNAAVVSSGCLMLAIVLFLIAIEFFILCIYHCEHIGFFGLLGVDQPPIIVPLLKLELLACRTAV